MSILNASILFARADNVRTQLDYMSGHECTSKEEMRMFNNLLRALDKIYGSANTREHRLDLQSFILLNGDAIYQRYVELTKEVLMEDSYLLKVDR